jgi:hypothetical protein
VSRLSPGPVVGPVTCYSVRLDQWAGVNSLDSCVSRFRVSLIEISSVVRNRKSGSIARSCVWICGVCVVIDCL